MVLGKLFRIYHKNDKNGVYSLLLENKNDKNETLLFESGAVGVLSMQETESVKPLYSMLSDMYGVLGTLNLSIADGNLIYLVCVSGCVSVGKIQNSEIFCITETTFISLRNSPSDLERIQDVRKILNSGTFYFSWSPNQESKYDLTLCAQKAERTTATDNRFFWNRMLYLHLKSFDVNTERWLLKVMCGGVCINTVYVGHQQAKACLISRLSCERAGTRFNVRGTNDNGHVANFVETEQVIFMEQKVSSYILIRGSIPLFWEQTGVQVGTHKLKMSRGSEISQPAFDRHLAMIKFLYGKQVLINLVGNKEGEHMIGTMYKHHHKLSQFHDDIPYIAFDYHYYCPRGKEDNLALLKKQINTHFNDFGYYYSDDSASDSNASKLYQTGTFRVNCIDCLDRTNRVQTFMGLEILMRQLKTLQFDEKATIVSRFQEVYKNMWQTNGDQVSRIYAGTGALEGKSKLRDGTLSVARTIQNNLLDNSKQEAIDILLTGKPLNNEYGDKARSILPLQYLHLPSSILKPLIERCFEYVYPIDVKIAVGTWNVNGGKHFNSIIYKKSDPLSDWLLDCNKSNGANSNMKSILDLSLDDTLTDLNANSPDLFAVGFEEIVDLSAQNIVATSTTNQKEWLTELEKTLSRNEQYVLVTSVQLVGVCLFLFTKPKFARFIRDVSTDSVKTGLGGATGNKGGVGIRLRLFSSSLCFVCSHFAAGQSQSAERNSDFNEIGRKMFNSIGKSLSSHDYVFWCGDFNYRIDLPIEEVKQLVKDKNWEQLLAHDQLLNNQKAEKVFRNYHEGTINFPPTYKYDINSDDYDTSEKSRIPAWTDRVLFRKRYPTKIEEVNAGKLDYGEIVFYGRAELKTSDHRPVLGEFKVDILKVDEDKRVQVFHNIIEQMGPLDSTVMIHESGSNGETSTIFHESYVQEILFKLNEEIGEIILARFGSDHMRVTFKDGTQALKLLSMKSINIMDKRFDVSLKTPNWIDLVEEEVNYGVSNTIPLLEGCKQLNIDELTDYDISKLSRISSPVDSESSLSLSTAPGPARPPPPKTGSNGGGDSGAIKPMRPAPPRPTSSTRKASNTTIEPIITMINDDLTITGDSLLLNQDNSMQPPPPPITQQMVSSYQNQSTLDDDYSSDDEFAYGTNNMPPMAPPPNIPPPMNAPPPLPPPNGPPPVPMVPPRRSAPTIPPRNT